MVNGRVLGVLAAALMFSTGLFAQEQRKLDDAQKKELDVVRKLVDDVIKGQAGAPAPPNDLGLTWAREDFLKEANNTQFVPFVVTIDPSKVTGGSVFFYWRVLPPADAPAGKDKKKAGNIWEDISSAIPVSGTEPFRISRAFAAPAGTYTAYIVVKEPTPKDKKQPVKTSVLKQTVTVPDFWTSELTTSSVMLAQKTVPVTEQLSAFQMIERPYALGSQEVVPSLDGKLKKSGELSVFMFIYNAVPESAGKPNVLLEFNFYTKGADGEKFFNKTSPQELSAKTLPASFDLAAGHQLPGFLAVPLGSFPEGEYRVEIKVTDKVSSKSITREAKFTVSGA